MYTVLFENELPKLKNMKLTTLEDVQIVFYKHAKDIMHRFFKTILKADNDNIEFYDYEDIYFSIRKCQNDYLIYFGDDPECEIHAGNISEKSFYEILRYVDNDIIGLDNLKDLSYFKKEDSYFYSQHVVTKIHLELEIIKTNKYLTNKHLEIITNLQDYLINLDKLFDIE